MDKELTVESNMQGLLVTFLHHFSPLLMQLNNDYVLLQHPIIIKPGVLAKRFQKNVSSENKCCLQALYVII